MNFRLERKKIPFINTFDPKFLKEHGGRNRNIFDKLNFRNFSKRKVLNDDTRQDQRPFFMRPTIYVVGAIVHDLKNASPEEDISDIGESSKSNIICSDPGNGFKALFQTRFQCQEKCAGRYRHLLHLKPG